MRKLGLVLIVAVALAFPALALANKIKVSGGVIHDSDSRVTATVVKKHHKVTQIKHMKLKGIDFRCHKQHYENLGNVKVTAAIPVHKSGSFKERLPNVENHKEKMRISGRVSHGGKQVTGNVKTNKLTINGTRCSVPKQHFVLTK